MLESNCQKTNCLKIPPDFCSNEYIVIYQRDHLFKGKFVNNK